MRKFISSFLPESIEFKGQKKVTIILLLAAILPAMHRAFGSIEFARRTFPDSSEFFHVLYMFVFAFLLFAIIPLITIRCFFPGPLKEYGVQLGEWRYGLLAVLILFVMLSGIVIFPSSLTSEIRAFFPYDSSAGDSLFSFVRLQFFRGLFFYLAWEFFFRGFILFGLRKHFGDWIAICIQTIPSCLWHIGLPAGEMFSAIVAGLIFGLLAIRTRSILWPFLLHYLIGIILDFFIILTV